MWSYIVEVQICWLIFLGFYWASLRSETYFYANRWYLLTTLTLGMVLPFVKLSQYGLDLAAESLSYELPLFLVNGGNGSMDVAGLNSNFWWYAYWSGAGLMLMRLFIGITRLWHMIQTGMLIDGRSHIIVQLPGQFAPFSFFRFLFLPQDHCLLLSESEKQILISHELVHIKSWHSLDRILLEVLSVFFWFSPLIWLYKAAVKDVHEFEADANAKKITDLDTYGQLLLKYIDFAPALRLSNPFFSSQLKRRFIMMTKNPSNQVSLIKYLGLIPLLLMSIFVLSCKDKILVEVEDQYEKGVLYAPDDNEEVLDQQIIFDRWGQPIEGNNTGAQENLVKPYVRVDEMPHFGEKEGNDLINYLSSNLTYPTEASEKGIEGTVVAAFIVGEDGSLSDVHIVRSLSPDTDKAVVDLLRKMPNWHPGKLGGVPVPVRFTLPVRFRLD